MYNHDRQLHRVLHELVEATESTREAAEELQETVRALIPALDQDWSTASRDQAFNAAEHVGTAASAMIVGLLDVVSRAYALEILKLLGGTPLRS